MTLFEKFAQKIKVCLFLVICQTLVFTLTAGLTAMSVENYIPLKWQPILNMRYAILLWIFEARLRKFELWRRPPNIQVLRACFLYRGLNV